MERYRWARRWVLLLAVVMFALTACTCNGCQMAAVVGEGDVTQIQGGDGWFDVTEWDSEDWTVAVVMLALGVGLLGVCAAASATGMGPGPRQG